MKYSRQDLSQLTRVSRRSLIAVAIAATVLTAGVATTRSMRSASVQKSKVEERKAQVANPSYRNYVTSNPSGQLVVLDRQTGQTRPLTSEEARRLAEGLKQMLNQSTDGLVQIQHSDGSVEMDLQGHFQNVMLAKKDEDGNITTACVDNVDSAAAFFEIDPALLGSKTPATKAPSSLNPIR